MAHWKTCTGEGIGGQHSSQEAEIPLLEIGGLKIENLFALAEQSLGHPDLDITLGERLLRDIIVEINFQQQIASFFQPDIWSCPQENENVQIFDLELEQGVLPVLRNSVKLNDEIIVPLTMLDTGYNDSILLSQNLAQKSGIIEDQEKIETVKGEGFSSNIEVQKGILKKVKIGTVILTDVTAYAFPKVKDSIFGRSDWINIGNRIFENYIVTWAIPYKKFIIKKLF